MTKLTDTQMILLSQASQREDHSLLPVPASIRTSGQSLVDPIAAISECRSWSSRLSQTNVANVSDAAILARAGRFLFSAQFCLF